MFVAEERDRIKASLIKRAEADERIVAAALVGASATGSDRWSDLDLTFGIGSNSSVGEVRADWTIYMVETYRAAVLFDIAAGSTIYRVFLLPGALQIDLSFGPEGEWGRRGPRFELLFGEAASLPEPTLPTVEHLFGYGVHHLVRARICIARGRFWQAVHWLNEAREIAMTLACRSTGLDEQYGRGFDQLPAEIQEKYRPMLNLELNDVALDRTLKLVAGALIGALATRPDLIAAIGPSLEPILGGDSA